MKLNKNISGFTLFELLVTIGLISVMLLLGFNLLSNSIAAQSIKSSVSQVAFAVKNARYYAKKNGVITEIQFEEGSNHYSLIADNKEITDTTDFGLTSGDLTDGNKIINNGCNGVKFYIDGTPITASNPIQPLTTNCIITVGKNGNNNRPVTIHAISGDITHE